MPQICDNFTSLPKKGMLRIFSPEKNPTASAGSEPEASMLTTRTPKPLSVWARRYLVLRTLLVEVKRLSKDYYKHFIQPLLWAFTV
jgi:hypothetical protein